MHLRAHADDRGLDDPVSGRRARDLERLDDVDAGCDERREKRAIVTFKTTLPIPPGTRGLKSRVASGMTFSSSASGTRSPWTRMVGAAGNEVEIGRARLGGTAERVVDGGRRSVHGHSAYWQGQEPA